jgi:hypothetical protein
LTEWQLYAQKLEGDQWAGDKLDKAKLDKMSGMFLTVVWALPRLIKLLTFVFIADQQLGQLLELMQALKKEGEGEDQ